MSGWPYHNVKFKHRSHVRRTFDDITPGSFIMRHNDVMFVIGVVPFVDRTSPLKLMTAVVNGGVIQYHIDCNIDLDSYGWREL